MGAEAMDAGSATLGLALAVVFASVIPMWALVLWMASTSSPPWRWIAERRWLKALAWLVYGLAALVVANVGWIWAYRDLVGPGRRTEQRIVYGAAGALQVLCGLAMVWVQKRRSAAGGAPPKAAPSKPTPGILLVILLVWVVLATAFAVVKFGPLATARASAVDRGALGVACVVIAILAVLLARSVREARQSRATHAGDSTEGN